MDSDKIKGKFSNKEYYAKDAIRILDPKQAALYWNNHVEPLDIYPSRDYKTNKALIVFVLYLLTVSLIGFSPASCFIFSKAFVPTPLCL